jgi:hypothetical protein
MIIVRYADDIVVGFEHEADARRFWDAMRERLREFSLSLHPDKTRLIEFGRFAAEPREARARQTGDLHVPGLCASSAANPGGATSRSGGSHAATACARSCGRSRKRCDSECTANPETGKWLGQIVAGYFAYHAVPTNSAALERVPLPRHRPLAPAVRPAQPESATGVAANGETGRRISPQAADPSSLAKCALCRQTPEVGAECPNWARSDLCGGAPSGRIGRGGCASVSPSRFAAA